MGTLAARPFPRVPQFAGRPGAQFISGGGGGTTPGGGGLPPVGLPIDIANFIGSLFGGSDFPPAFQQLAAGFSSINDPIAGHTIEVDQIIGSSTPQWAQIPPGGPPGDPGMKLKDLLDMVYWSGPAVFLAGGGLHQFVSSTNPNTTTTASSGAEQDIINVVNNFTAQNNIDTSSIGTAISSGLSDVVNQITTAQQQVTQSITQTVSGFGNSLFGWAKDLGKWIVDNIGQVLEAIGSKLKDIASSVYNVVKDAVTSVVEKLSATIGPAIDKIASDIGKVVDFYQQHIQPILETIQKIEQTVSAAITAIQADLHSGIQGLLQLPTDLSNALQGIDSALIRAGVALRVKKLSDADVQWVTKDGKSITDHIKSLGDAVIGLSPQKVNTTYSPGTEHLSEPTLAEELPALLGAVNTILLDLAKGIKNLAESPTDALGTMGLVATGIFAGVFEPVELLLLLYELAKAPLEVVSELCAEVVREKTQLTKLDAQTLAQLWRRNLVTKEDMDAELATQGYNGVRSDLLRRLITYEPDPNQLVEWYFRGVIDETTLHGGLHQLAWTDNDITALLAGSTQLLAVADALTAYHRNEIDETTLNETFAANRYGDAERDLLKSLSLRPPSYTEAYEAYLTTRLLNDYAEPVPVYDTIPDAVKQAGQAEGLSPEAVLARWTSQVNTLSSQQWLQLYWRGQASITQLKVALQRDRVPDAHVQDWIDSQRPLIPYRTIPSLVKAGLLDEATALQKLQAVGYDLVDATLLLKYATAASNKGKATTAAKQVDVSLTQAKLAYQDGIYTKDQYLAVLKAHGLDDTAAGLEISLEDIARETKDRKQIATDVVNEFQAGMIDEATATQQLADSGLTLAEQAAAQKRMRSARSAKAKIPSEAELRAMAVKQVITVDDYEANLITSGYSSTWAAAFRALHFPSS